MSVLDMLGGFVTSAIVVVLLAVLEQWYRDRCERFRRRGGTADSRPPLTD
jgi:hypothetical protein